MREIKFRFWNEQAHKYHYRANQVMPCLENQVCLGYDYTKEGCAFEQFTGLHDCTKWQDLTEDERAEWTRNGHMPSEWKGHEIYEGDILKTYNPDGVSAVTYLDYGFLPFTSQILSAMDTYSEWEFDGYEVIGNIHENPDLIEASHA